MRLILSIFTVSMLSLACCAQDQSEFKKETFISSTGLSLPYRILFPENYDKTKKYPVVLFLHGAGERGDNNESQLVHGSKLFLDPANRKAYPAIVIFPQCAAESYWSSVKVNREKMPLELDFDYTRPITPALQAAIELLKKTLRTEATDKKRVYVAGLSMGGMGTFESVYRFPKLFAAAVPICGGGDVDAYDKRVIKVPFRVFHGAKDDVVDPRHSRAMVEKLKTLKAAVQYKEYPEANHNSWDSAFAEPDFLNWMFANSR
ncbi:MAG TPA: prolyl oligopeptidase family serine peptidase [Cyclobacteriaceae bacterium]|nr:prolyl oligopeptidase family serine peptidase [Cyclobacteriaceae bacterium]HMV08605.1 prolyl oligopeptidase family serine peptidase [Cyclobacteriaceae bacterium]HMV90592.1 prolyl oligopeptidase family serine peptidase [Cyclobacteriaceae bacterium]HMX00186.1 prolyl oligopeptidase family serine peptidase [Cyclobacteriaceae bacterium]HMX49815.1 prolyl oligopeptidase family serine peptidase [Cyclobacteriaceae bacterium]